MNIDLTVIISVVLALVAIISPIISSIIDNRYKFKMKQLETQTNIRNKSINEFIDITLNFDYVGSQINDFYKSLNKVSLFADENTSKTLGEIKYLVETKADIKEVNSALLKFVICSNDYNNKSKT